MKDTIICDIDGTLCTDAHRNHLVQGMDPKDRKWDEYFDLCHLDPPVQAVIETLRAFASCPAPTPYRIHLMTARIDRVRQKTLNWLEQHHVPYDDITFRPTDSRVQDNVLKTAWADQLGGPEKILLVLEDRQRVVDAWRIAGYTCFQVARGDF